MLCWPAAQYEIKVLVDQARLSGYGLTLGRLVQVQARI